MSNIFYLSEDRLRDKRRSSHATNWTNKLKICMRMYLTSVGLNCLLVWFSWLVQRVLSSTSDLTDNHEKFDVWSAQDGDKNESISLRQGQIPLLIYTGFSFYKFLMAVLFIFLVSFPFPFFVKYCDVRLNDPRTVDWMKRISVIRVLMTLLSKILRLGLHTGGEDIGDQDGNAIPMTVAVTHPPPQ